MLQLEQVLVTSTDKRPFRIFWRGVAVPLDFFSLFFTWEDSRGGAPIAIRRQFRIRRGAPTSSSPRWSSPWRRDREHTSMDRTARPTGPLLKEGEQERIEGSAALATPKRRQARARGDRLGEFIIASPHTHWGWPRCGGGR